MTVPLCWVTSVAHVLIYLGIKSEQDLSSSIPRSLCNVLCLFYVARLGPLNLYGPANPSQWSPQPALRVNLLTTTCQLGKFSVSKSTSSSFGRACDCNISIHRKVARSIRAWGFHFPLVFCFFSPLEYNSPRKSSQNCMHQTKLSSPSNWGYSQSPYCPLWEWRISYWLVASVAASITSVELGSLLVFVGESRGKFYRVEQ